jgi:hypothetical protein
MLKTKQKTKEETKHEDTQIPESIPVIDSSDILSQLNAVEEDQNDWDLQDDGEPMADEGECGCF